MSKVGDNLFKDKVSRKEREALREAAKRLVIKRKAAKKR